MTNTPKGVLLNKNPATRLGFCNSKMCLSNLFEFLGRVSKIVDEELVDIAIQKVLGEFLMGLW